MNRKREEFIIDPSIKFPYTLVTLGRFVCVFLSLSLCYSTCLDNSKKEKHKIRRKDPEAIQYKSESLDESIINQSNQIERSSLKSGISKESYHLKMSSSSAAFAPDHHLHHHHLSPPSGEQLCYVRCNFCDTILAVSVPCSSFFKNVTVRCGHCTNILFVNIIHPTAANHLHLPHSFFSPHNLLDEIRNNPPSLLMNQPINPNESLMPVRGGVDELPKPPVANRPPEKRQRVPSAYNRFIKDEIQRIKAGNPDISHREAFSAAAKNWAHFPHIHFGLMPDQPVKKPNACQQEEEDVLMKEGFLAPANIGVSPY